MKRLLLTSLTLASVWAGSTAARAGVVTVFTTQASFQAVAPSATLETFDTFPTANAPVTADGITVSDPRSGVNGVFVGTANYASGKSVQLSTGTPSGSVLALTFSSPITALGINIYDLGTVNPTNFTFTLSNGDSGTLASAYSAANGNVIFRGVTDTTAFSSITFSNSVSGDYIEFDNLRYGTAVAGVPEPGSLALAAGGAATLFGLGVARRRKAAR